MPRLITKKDIELALARRLKLRAPEFHLKKLAGGRVNGSVISPSFKGKRDDERQNMIWDALERGFGPQSVRVVGMILAYTPEEWDLDAVAS